MKVSKSYIRFLWGTVLVAGCVPGLFSCGKQQAVSEENHNQNMITQQSENLEIIQTKGGKLIYRFKAPLLEEYEYAAEPYIEFRKGIEIETYNDTTQQVEATLTANYAIYLKNQQLWRLDKNVRIENTKQEVFLTSQIFWDQRKREIYSDSFIHIETPDEVIEGYGFNSNEQMTRYRIRRTSGIFPIKRDTVAADSARTDSVKPQPVPAVRAKQMKKS